MGDRQILQSGGSFFFITMPSTNFAMPPHNSLRITKPAWLAVPARMSGLNLADESQNHKTGMAFALNNIRTNDFKEELSRDTNHP